MVVNPLPGTRVKTDPELLDQDEPPPIRYGAVVSFLGMLICVKWDDGTETDINAFYLDRDDH
jgi:hypothetical protein